ncbi:MAG: EamA family transporter [Flavobacteriaceae bacterium TMED48]|nr:MAG: EamA family transporter [Flavobacteriaceae bacterium TMED48]
MQDVKTKSLIHYHLIVFIFGFSSVMGALCSLDAIPLVVYRMTLACLGLAVYFAIIHPTYFKLEKTLWVKVILGGLIIGVHWVTFFHAIKVAGVSLTLSMMATGAFITAMIEPLINKRKILGYELLFGGLIAVGVGMIFQAEYEHLYGISIALLSAFLSSVFTILNTQLVKRGRAITLSFYELSVGAIFGIVYVIFSGNYTFEAFALHQWDWLWIGLIAWVCTSYAFNISIKVMQHLPPFTVMLIINLEPVYGILLSLAIWRDEELMSFRFYLGFVIVLVAILLNGIYKRQKQIG